MNYVQVTWSNYKAILPENLHPSFEQLANCSRAQYNPIVYCDKVLRYANVDEC